MNDSCLCVTAAPVLSPLPSPHTTTNSRLLDASCLPDAVQVAEAIASAVERGLSLPIIYNTSSYDALASLALMDGLVDIVRGQLTQGLLPRAAPRMP